MQSHTGCMCLAFLHCVSSNVSSNGLYERIHSYIDCICLTLKFLHLHPLNQPYNFKEFVPLPLCVLFLAQMVASTELSLRFDFWYISNYQRVNFLKAYFLFSIIEPQMAGEQVFQT